MKLKDGHEKNLQLNYAGSARTCCKYGLDIVAIESAQELHCIADFVKNHYDRGGAENNLNY
jgi:hypothetical protein